MATDDDDDPFFSSLTPEEQAFMERAEKRAAENRAMTPEEVARFIEENGLQDKLPKPERIKEMLDEAIRRQKR